ncbi:MAG: hypothetical protein ACYC1M_19005 [Armatimonadota bacterium]
MKKSVWIGVVSVLLAVVIGWLWSVRLIGFFYSQEANQHFFEENPPTSVKVLPLNPWPNLIIDEDSPEYDIQPIIDKMPRLLDLAKKSSLSSTEKAQMAFLESRMFSTGKAQSLHNAGASDAKSIYGRSLEICAVGQRQDPGNGLYPMLEAMMRLEIALMENTPKIGLGQRPVMPGSPGPMPALPNSPRPDRKPSQSEPIIPPMTMPPGGTPKPSAPPTMAPLLMPKPQKKRPEPSYTVVDRTQLLLAIQAYARASKLPIQRHIEDVMPLRVSHPVITEQFATNMMMMMSDIGSTYSSRQREMARQLASVGPKLAQMGYKNEAQQLMGSLLPFSSQEIRDHGGRIIEVLVAKAVLKYNQKTAIAIASSLGLPAQKQKFEQTKHNIDVLNPQITAVFKRSISNGGLLTMTLSDAVGSTAPFPAAQLAAARMVEYTLVDEAVIMMLLIAWLALLVVGLVRSGVWRLICRKTSTSVAELDWLPELKQLLIWWLLVPLAVYTLLTQAAWMPWRGSNIGLATGIEKTALMALSLIVPWVIWRFRIKKMCIKQAIPIPGKGVEVLWNWLPVIGLVPLLVITNIWLKMLDETPDMPVGSTTMVLAVVFLVLWLASVISVFALKQRFRAYYAAAARTMQPLFVWSILVVSLTLMPVLLAREVVWLQRDNLGIGSCKKVQLSLPVEAQSARWLEGKLLEAIR